MFKQFQYVIVFALISQYTVAFQSFSRSDSTILVVPQSGSRALEFGFSGIFNFSSFMSQDLAYKKFLTPYKARRYFFSFNINGTTSKRLMDQKHYTIETDSLTGETNLDVDDDRNSTILTIGLQNINYRKPYGNLAFCYGGGPLLEMNYYLSNEFAEEIRNPGSTTNNDRSATTLELLTGITYLVGVEWFLHKNVSFHAEYHNSCKIGIFNEVSYTEREGFSTLTITDLKENGYLFRLNGRAWVGISFYFE